MRIKICLKESKESNYWSRIIIASNENNFAQQGGALANEAQELKKIFCSILLKSSNKGLISEKSGILVSILLVLGLFDI